MMARDNFVAVNRRFEDERRAKYCGTASLEVEALRFRSSKTVTLSRSKNTESLKRMFREERGCRREDSRHHAKALISQHTLEVSTIR